MTLVASPSPVFPAEHPPGDASTGRERPDDPDVPAHGTGRRAPAEHHGDPDHGAHGDVEEASRSRTADHRANADIEPTAGTPSRRWPSPSSAPTRDSPRPRQRSARPWRGPSPPAPAGVIARRTGIVRRAAQSRWGEDTGRVPSRSPVRLLLLGRPAAGRLGRERLNDRGAAPGCGRVSGEELWVCSLGGSDSRRDQRRQRRKLHCRVVIRDLVRRGGQCRLPAAHRCWRNRPRPPADCGAQPRC